MARPSFAPNDELRRLVLTMSGLGARQDEIARKLDICPQTLRKHFRRELDCGTSDANLQVINALFKMAISGKSPAATIFWAKSRCGWREHTAAIQATPPAVHLHIDEPAK